MNRSLAAALCAVVVLSCVPARAGYSSAATGAKGVQLTAAQVAAVNAAIAKLEALAAAEGNAQNKATMERVIKALKEMMKPDKNGNRRICSEGAKPAAQGGPKTWAGITRQDGKCDASGDAMNICPDLLAAGEPMCSILADTLFHEGVHTQQWAAPGSIYGGTEASEEWVAYSWGKYVLQKLLNNPALTPAQKKRLQEELKHDCRERDAYCASAEEERKKAAKAAGGDRKRSCASADYIYTASYPHSGRIEVLHDWTGDVPRILDTGMAISTGMACFRDSNAGREHLFVGATDSGAATGAVALFSDMDGDELLDQDSIAVFGLAGGAVPLSMVTEGSSLWVLAMPPGSGTSKQVIRIVDVTGDGIPDSAAQTIYADGLVFPAINQCQTFKVDGPGTISMSPRWPGMSIENSLMVIQSLTDVNADGVADVISPITFDDSLAPLTPVFYWRPAFFDVFCEVQAHPLAQVQVVRTDPSGLPLELLGQSPGASGWERQIPLFRPLQPGDFIVLHDATNDLESAVVQVQAPRPQIIGISEVEVLPGQVVHLQTRFTNPDPSLAVNCSGLPTELILVTPNSIEFIAPTATQTPNGHITIQVTAGPDASNEVGLLIQGDCNGNGQADIVDIATGVSQDLDADGIPDECEACPADLNQDGLVDFTDYLEFLNLYEAQDLRVDYNGDGLVDFLDYLEFLNHYDAGC
ncbi:MAG: hypothetical protein IT436_11170 [Phycisphaerales bacterium]|nr:hypothetical protein [Phycisphaerales bacterium]